MESRNAMRALTAGLLLSLSAASSASAQPVISYTEKLDFDRPEAWAMAYVGSATLLTGLGAPRHRPAGSFELGVEADWLPSFTDEELTVGFYGTKQEDLNRTEIFGRPRVTIWLPASFALELGWVPPVQVEGIEPNIISAALARPLYESAAFRLGLRVHGQWGTIEGDITCPADVAAAGDDPVANPFGCEAPSRDELDLSSYSVELAGALPLPAAPKVEPFLAVALHRFDNEFQVDARYNGLHDRALLVAEGSTWSAAAGISGELGERFRMSAELFYTPLELQREEGGPTTTEELLNLRFLLAYRLR